MTGAITQNFRGLHALVIHPDDANRAVLTGVLRKLGLAVTLHDGPDRALADCDVLFVDADEGLDAETDDADSTIPCVALIGTEAPSRLSRVVRRNCASHILKPIRSTGVYTALLLAVNEHERRRKVAREIEALRRRLAGRRIVTRAVLDLMRVHGIGQDTAYELLRVTAMNRRVPIDELARERLSDAPCAPGPNGHDHDPTIGRRLTP